MSTAPILIPAIVVYAHIAAATCQIAWYALAAVFDKEPGADTKTLVWALYLLLWLTAAVR